MAYDIDPSREWDVPDPVHGSDPLGLEGITHSYAPWDNPDVSGDALERYGLRPRDSEGNEITPPGFFTTAATGALESLGSLFSGGAIDAELTPGGYDLFGGRRGDLSSLLAGGTGEQPYGTVDVTAPLTGLTSLLVPTARFGKRGASMHGGVTGPAVFLAEVMTSPAETFKTAKERLTSPALLKDPVKAIRGLGEKALEIYSTTIPSNLDPNAEPPPVGPVEETRSQSQTTASVNEKNQSWPPENLNEGPDALPLIKKPLSVAARPAAPVEPLPVQAPETRLVRLPEDEGFDPFKAGFSGPHRFFERQPVTAEGGGLMDLQHQADTLAAQGRGGDTMLVHMRPDEVAGLASLGTVTRNPVTGLPENFLGPALGALLGGALMGPGAGFLTSALATGAGAGLGQYAQSKVLGEDDPLRRGLIAGLTAGIGSAALGGFGKAFGTASYGPDPIGTVGGNTGVSFEAGKGMGLGTGLENLGNKARAALATNLGTTSGLMGSVGGIGADADAQQRLAAQGGMPIREASTYRGTDSYGAPRLSPRVPTGLDQTDLRTYGFGPEQQFFGPRVRAQAGGLQGEDFGTRGIRALLAFRDQNAADLQRRIDERDDPLYLDDTQDMTLTAPEGGDGLAASIVDQAIAAIKGDHPQGEVAVDNFIKEFGEEAFVGLRRLIMQELRVEAMGEIKTSGLLEGSDGGRDDLRRGKIDGLEDVNVSSGEYIVSADDVSLFGDGNNKAGGRRLDLARKNLREKATGTAQRPDYIGEEGVEEVFDEVMTA